jgi:hypothetical protein
VWSSPWSCLCLIGNGRSSPDWPVRAGEELEELPKELEGRPAAGTVITIMRMLRKQQLLTFEERSV